MHVLHIDSGRELRGGQRQLLLLARGLTQKGHEQTILARHGSPLSTEGHTLSLSTRALIAEARRADLVHAHDARSHTLAALAVRGRPLVVSRRVAFPVGAGPLSRWKYERPTRFLAVSEFVRSQLCAAGVPPEKISVVYDGVEIRHPFRPAPASGPVVAPATGDPQKGSGLAAEACRAAGVELQFSSGLDVDLPHASLFLYLTHSEGLGSAILLAMAQGVPVVASRAGGIPEIVEHQRTGLLVENTVKDVQAAIEHTRRDYVSATERSRAAYDRVAARFTDAIMVAQTEQAYRLALNHHS